MQPYPFHHRHRLPGLFVLFLLATASMIAQTPNPLDFFPHAVGNTWEYSDEETGERVWTITIVGDTVNSYGDSLVTYREDYPKRKEPLYGYYFFEHPYRVYSTSAIEIPRAALEYQLDADSGATWLLRPTDSTQWVEILGVSRSAVFGKAATKKTFEYSIRNGGARQWGQADVLATGFGLIYQAFHPFLRVYLSGAIIDGKRYGRISGVDETPLPTASLRCSPNPATYRSAVTYDVPALGHVQIIVADMLGREVARPVDEIREPGNYRTTLDCSAFPQGLYVVRIVVGDVMRSTALHVRR